MCVRIMVPQHPVTLELIMVYTWYIMMKKKNITVILKYTILLQSFLDSFISSKSFYFAQKHQQKKFGRILPH